MLSPLPPPPCGRLIEAYAGLISDPAQKLRFLKGVLRRYEKTSRLYKCSTTFQETILTQIAIDELEGLSPDIHKKAQRLIRTGQVPTPSGLRWYIYKFRNVALVLIAAAFLLGLGSAVASLKRDDPKVDVAIEKPKPTQIRVSMGTDPESSGKDESTTPAVNPDAAGSMMGSEKEKLVTSRATVAAATREVEKPLDESYANAVALTGSDVLSMVQDREENENVVNEYIEKAIWLVEKGPDSELYSNGLRIITSHTVENEPRMYYRFKRGEDGLPTEDDITDEIVGILYHAAESDMIDFRPEKNESINRYSKALVRYIGKKKAYNYFIDRFGRVYRIVKDTHAAYHAGWSVWADRELVYLNLNHAFIGICFEGKDFEVAKEGESDVPGMSPVKDSVINDGQLTSGKKLTDWLRAKYRIGQHNCVAHGLTSVNPQKMLIGYHLDLAKGFPYGRFGLKDKTKAQLPAITDCGFHYDDHFVKVFNGDLWEGIAYSEDYIRHHAEIAGMSTADYKQVLADRFTKWFELYKRLHG